ncbi:hypothetical protein TKK_0006443 [Trichogramma kaykai]
MDSFKNKDYGTKIEYDPLWEGPMKTNRTKTDKGFLIGFVVFLSSWLIIGGIMISQGYGIGSISDDNSMFDFKSLSKHQGVIISMIFMGIALAVGYIVALRWFAKFIVWSAIVLTIVILTAGVIFSIAGLSQNNKSVGGEIYVKTGLMVIFLIVFVFFVIYFRKKIKVACEVIREASKAHLSFASSFFILLIPAVFYLASLVFFLVVLLNAQSIATVKYEDGTPFWIYAVHLINFFGLLWSCSFTNGLTQMALAGAFGTWYWTHRKENVPRFTLLKSCKTVVVFHMGTVAFGSLVIAICQLIKSLFQAARSDSGNSGNGFGRLMSCWCGFLWENIEQFVKFMGRNAYVMSAIHGTNFFTSAKNAFNLIMRNLVSTLVLNNVIDAVLGLGVLIVFAVTSGVTYALVHKDQEEDSTIAIAILLVLVVTLFFVIPIFMVLQVACDTIFLCVLEDYERHDDSETKPYYMSKKLKRLLLTNEEEIRL